VCSYGYKLAFSGGTITDMIGTKQGGEYYVGRVAGSNIKCTATPVASGSQIFLLQYT